MRRLLKLAILQAIQGFVLRRWLLLPVAFTLFALFVKSRMDFDYLRQAPAQLNLWDILPGMLAYKSSSLWAFVLGFALLTGDGLARARASGAATMVLIRTSSRSAWWASRIATMGLQASCYIAAGTAVILIVGAWMFPVSLEPSPFAQTLTRETVLYPRLTSWPMPAFTLAIAARIALGLWFLGSLMEVVFLFFSRRPLAPLLLVVAWLFTSLDGILPRSIEEGPARWVKLTHLISYADHLAPAGISFATFLLVWTAAMSALYFLGAMRLRHLDF
jgi:hypothetical protein